MAYHRSLGMREFATAVLVTVAIAIVGNWDAIRSGRAGDLWRHLSTPRSGEREVHPTGVQAVIDYCRDRGVREIAFSPVLGKNRFLAQPLTEGVYPTVVRAGAAVYISTAAEQIPAGFVTDHVRQGLRIARRP